MMEVKIYDGVYGESVECKSSKLDDMVNATIELIKHIEDIEERSLSNDDAFDRIIITAPINVVEIVKSKIEELRGDK